MVRADSEIIVFLLGSRSLRDFNGERLKAFESKARELQYGEQSGKHSRKIFRKNARNLVANVFRMGLPSQEKSISADKVPIINVY